VKNCLACGNSLLINGRIRLLRPLRSLEENLYTNTNVFEVEDAGTKLHPESQVRVMKVLKWNEPKLVQLVQREARILQIIQYPGIPDSARDDYFTFKLKDTLLELHCLVMQKVEGENLRQWLKSYGRIPQNVAFDWLSQLIDTLDVVHRSGFFHRDIKPENIIHKPDGKLVLVDFGAAREITSTYLAKVSTNGGSSTGLGSGYEVTSVITAFFSPPEQMNGQAVPQSDFYALGRTFVNLVTGMSLMDLSTNEKTGRLIWRKYAPQIDKPFADLLDDLMASSPGQRPQSTQVILQRLERLPFKLKLNRLTEYKLFKLSLFLVLLLVVFNIRKGYNLGLSNYYFNEASRHLDEPKIAKKYYELAAKYNPTDVAAYSNLALACQQLYDIRCVTENYEKAFKLQPNSWEARYGLGNFYDEQGKYDLAEQQYKLAIQYSNNQAMNAVSNLARIKNRQEKYSEAATLAIQGLSRTKNPEWQAGLYKNLGWARFKQQRYAEAEDYLQKSVKLDSQRVDAYCLLAQMYEAVGNLGKAKIYWEVCLIAVSGLPEVQEWRQQVLQRIFKEN
jgi:serine/threonine protein kinase